MPAEPAAPRQSGSWWFYAAHLCGAVGLLGLIGVVARQLFTGITVVGMKGVDTFTYLNDTLALLDPNGPAARLLPPGEQINRVMVFALDLIALRVLGVNDYAIRAFVGGAQLVSIGLVYLLGVRVSRNPVLALGAAALYAFNFWTTAYARSELPHAYAAMFVLLATCCAVAALAEGIGRRARAIATAAAGFFAAGAAATHEDQICFAAGLALFAAAFVIIDERRRSGRWVAQVSRLAGAFSLGFVAGLAWPMLVTGIGPQRLVADFISFHADMAASTSDRTAGTLPRFLRLVAPRVAGEFAFDLVGLPLVVLTAVVSVAAPLYCLVGRDRRMRAVLFVEALVAFYLVAFIFAVRVYLEGGYTRILIPMLGLTLVFTLSGGYALGAMALRRLVGGTLAAATATAACAALVFWSLPDDYGIADPPLTVTTDRLIYDAAKDRVSEDQRLMLPGCYGLLTPWMGVGSQIYLGDKIAAVYRSKNPEPFDRFVADQHVKYVLVLSDYDYREMTRLEDLEAVFATLYGAAITGEVKQSLLPASEIRRDPAWWLSPEAEQVWPGDTRVEWSPAACAYESALLTRALADRHATLAVRVPEVGDIYELP